MLWCHEAKRSPADSPLPFPQNLLFHFTAFLVAPPLFSALGGRDWASWSGVEAIPALEGQSEVAGGGGGPETEGGTGYLDWTGGRGGTHTDLRGDRWALTLALCPWCPECATSPPTLRTCPQCSHVLEFSRSLPLPLPLALLHQSNSCSPSDLCSVPPAPAQGSLS